MPIASPDSCWVDDARGSDRAVRVSTHLEGGFLVLSLWRSGRCAGTVRLLPAEAAELVAGISSGLAQLTVPILDE